jgi:hypothetical protein
VGKGFNLPLFGRLGTWPAKKHEDIMTRYKLLFATIALLACATARAQFKEGDAGGAKLGASQMHKWKAGVVVTAVGGPCQNIVGYMPVPQSWPEQTVRNGEQEITPGVKVSYEMVDGAKVMVVRIPLVQAGQQAKALITFEVTRSSQVLPDEKASFELAKTKELKLDVRRYLGPSPKIETQNAAIRKIAKETGAEQKTAWGRVQALYDYTRDHVKYQTGGQPRGAAGCLKDGVGDHDDMSALFIALCRAADIPARTVWVPEFSYAEFYLVDKKGEGHWLPCSPGGGRAFGEIQDTRPILEKGDNFKPLNNSRDHQRYLTEFLSGSPGRQGNGKPQVQFVRQML